MSMKNLISIIVLIMFLLPLSTYAQNKGAYKQVTYTIKKGDFLKAIAEKYGTTWEELHRLNPYIKNPNLIYPGKKIILIDRNKIEEKERKQREAEKARLAEQERQKKLAEQEKQKRLAEERQKKLAEEERQKKLAEQERQKKLAEQEGQKKLAEQERQKKLAEEERQKKLAEEERKRKLAEEERQRRLAEEERQRRLAEERYRKAAEDEFKQYPQYFAVNGFAKLPGDIETMEVAPWGYGGGLDYNIQINKWFAFMASVDGSYLYGKNTTKNIEAESIGISFRPYILFQPNIPLNRSGVQPYLGIGPSYTASIQYVYQDPANNCDMVKHHLGASAIAGINFIHKKFIFGLNFEYNYVSELSRDEQVIHLDMSSGFKGGIRIGGRF